MEDGRPNVGEDIPEGREKTWDVFGPFHDRSPFGPGRARRCAGRSAGRTFVAACPPGVRQLKGPDLVAKVRDSLKEPPVVDGVSEAEVQDAQGLSPSRPAWPSGDNHPAQRRSSPVVRGPGPAHTERCRRTARVVARRYHRAGGPFPWSAVGRREGTDAG